MFPSCFRHWLLSLGATRPSVGLLFATALIPGILIGSMLSYGIYQNERDDLEQGALRTARALIRAIDAELIKAQIMTIALSKSEYLATRDFSAFYTQAKEVIKATGTGNNIVLSEITGQQILNTARPFSGSLPRHGNPDHLRRVVDTGRPAISDLYVGPVMQQPLFSIDVPVVLDDKVAYVLSLGVLPEYFSRLLVEQALPTGWIAALLDSRDTVVARNLNPEQTVGKEATPDLRTQLRMTSEGTLASHTLEGRPSFVAFSRSTITHWTIAVGMLRDVLYANLHRLLVLVVLSVLAFVMGGAALAWMFSRYVRQSLEALGDATEAAALGDRNARAPISGLKEVARLADQFNHMQEARKQMEDQVRQLAFYDTLTNLPNRRLLKDRLSQAMAANRRSGHYGALMFLDLDNFKTLNDTHGHEAGDSLLIQAADRLRSRMREMDTVARFGGDEFVVLLSDLVGDKAESTQQAETVAEKLRSALSVPYRLTLKREGSADATIEHGCTVSIGVVLFTSHEENQDAIFKSADMAMYQAKGAGRNLIRVYDPGA